MSNDIQELTMKNLTSNDSYVIPIYQRNYAWGESEIEQLIQDIFDSFEKDSSSYYYLGSLVVFKREKEYETIDGQQRQTTLSILFSVLKNEFNLIENSIQVNLHFDSRKKSDKTLQALYQKVKLNNSESSLDSAYHDARRIFSKLLKENNTNEFFEYFLNHVKILRVVVPYDTDLNHYFEIMNNRGEQLEKHEVLKARLMDTIEKEEEKITFAKIWDACSQMNRYSHYGFIIDDRRKVFGDSLNNLEQSFSCIHNKIKPQKIESRLNEKKTLDEILKVRLSELNVKQKKNDESERFYSPINFSNFLLHTLRIITKKDIPLDDKQLLPIFKSETLDAKDFVYSLLKSRFIFDKYILKREWDDKWSLKSIRIYEKNKINYVNTFDENVNSNIIMILSMFHVSFPTLIYKHWLSGVLNYLYDNFTNINSMDYLNFLEEFNDKIFYGRFGQNGEMNYFDIIFKNGDIDKKFKRSFLNESTNISNFIFNRLDYLIWKESKKIKSIRCVKCKEIKKIDNFSFSFRSSVEHYYPQNPIDHEKLKATDGIQNGVDTFGNLCLISRSKNSKLSNYSPNSKKEHYKKSHIIESLKQQVMMSYDHWGNDSISNIIEHERQMIDLLCSEYSEIY